MQIQAFQKSSGSRNWTKLVVSLLLLIFSIATLFVNNRYFAKLISTEQSSSIIADEKEELHLLAANDVNSNLRRNNMEVVNINSNRLCTQNQYAKSLFMSLADYDTSMDDWLDNQILKEQQLLKKSIDLQPFTLRHDHSRFEAFEVMGSCNTTCVGGECNSDQAKTACGIDEGAMKAPCVIYSIGGNNKWDFELDVLKRTPCVVHTFDCTGDIKRFETPDHPRLHFHHICLGTKNKKDGVGEFWTLNKMTETFNHAQVDLLKLDIEGYEWPLLSSWPVLTDMASPKTTLPMQVLVEVHYQSQFKELSFSNRIDFKFPTDMIRLQEHFLRMGYAVVARDDNAACRHCTELTLVRIKCPSSHTSELDEEKVIVDEKE